MEASRVRVATAQHLVEAERHSAVTAGGRMARELGRQKVFFAVLVGVSCLAFGELLRWFVNQDLLGTSFWISMAIFVGFLGLPVFQMVMAIYLTFRFKVRGHLQTDDDLTVDVYVTVFDEPIELVEKTLRAAVEIRYPHQTYLLDDGRNEAFASVADRLGARYLSRPNNEDFKAGNLNFALARTSGEFVAIFDVDHTPGPDFLERTLGYFADPEIGFVQAMVTFSNQDESLVARASIETALDFYNITAVGKDRCGAASLIGSNAVIRRQALEETGLYKPGLAEDLETSLSLHAAGWKSAYVREPLAPGLSPSDFVGFLKQQLKWSSGVFEAAVNSLKGTFFKLTLQQKMCYLVRFSYYQLGVLVVFNLLALIFALTWPVPGIDGLILKILPFTVASWIVRIYPLRKWGLETLARKGFFVRGSSLFVVSWPAYVLATIATVLRVRVPFISTPKVAGVRLPWWSVAPQLGMLSVLSAAVVWRIIDWQTAPMPVTVGFAVFMMASHWILFVEMVRSYRSPARRR
jgi:cellulose synthase (UDP-forming)